MNKYKYSFDLGAFFGSEEKETKLKAAPEVETSILPRPKQKQEAVQEAKPEYDPYGFIPDFAAAYKGAGGVPTVGSDLPLPAGEEQSRYALAVESLLNEMQGGLTPQPDLTAATPVGTPDMASSVEGAVAEAMGTSDPAPEVQSTEGATTGGAGLMARPEATSSAFTVPEFKSYTSVDEMSDLEVLARTIEAEAAGEPYKGKIAVGSVIANRVASGSYGGSGGIKGVILKKGQFSPWNSYTGYAKGEQGKDMLNLKASEESYKAANAILTGNYTDETGGASHYVNPSVSTPDWLPAMKARKKGTVTIGNHLFGNADNEKVYDGKAGLAEFSSETTDQPLVAQAPTVKAIQRIVGASADGDFGPSSRKKALSYLANEGVDVPKDATNKQLMDLVINRPKSPLTPDISLPKVEEATTTEVVLDVVAQSAPQELLYNPLSYIKQNNLIGLDERTPEGEKAIDGFFRTAAPKGINALKMSQNRVSSTENAWCAVFVDHVLRTMGAPTLDPTTSPRGMKDKAQRPYAAMRAFEYSNYGTAVERDKAQAGDLVIMKGSHIGFFTGEKDAKGNYLVLGGNQSTKDSSGRGVSVNVAAYSPSKIKTIRRITDVSNIPTDQIKAMTATITGTDAAEGQGS